MIEKKETKHVINCMKPHAIISTATHYSKKSSAFKDAAIEWKTMDVLCLVYNTISMTNLVLLIYLMCAFWKPIEKNSNTQMH